MRQITITINTENTAFDENNLAEELATIFERMARQSREGSITGRIMDSNGNSVGRIDFR